MKQVDIPEVTTLFESFEKSVKEAPKNDCIGHREYDRTTKVWSPFIWQSYEAVQQRRNRFGSGLLNLFEAVARVHILIPQFFLLSSGFWDLKVLTGSLPEMQFPTSRVALLFTLKIVRNG